MCEEIYSLYKIAEKKYNEKIVQNKEEVRKEKTYILKRRTWLRKNTLWFGLFTDDNDHPYLCYVAMKKWIRKSKNKEHQVYRGEILQTEDNNRGIDKIRTASL